MVLSEAVLEGGEIHVRLYAWEKYPLNNIGRVQSKQIGLNEG